MEHGVASEEAVLAAVFGPALADFDALLFLRRDALPAADCALQSPKLWRSTAEKRGFVELASVGGGMSANEAGDYGKRARAVLRAVPQGVFDHSCSSCIALCAWRVNITCWSTAVAVPEEDIVSGPIILQPFALLMVSSATPYTQVSLRLLRKYILWQRCWRRGEHRRS